MYYPHRIYHTHKCMTHQDKTQWFIQNQFMIQGKNLQECCLFGKSNS